MGCMPMIIQLRGVVARAEGKRGMRTLPLNSPTITLGLTHPLFVIINTCSLFMSNSNQNLPLCFACFFLCVDHKKYAVHESAGKCCLG